MHQDLNGIRAEIHSNVRTFVISQATTLVGAVSIVYALTTII